MVVSNLGRIIIYEVNDPPPLKLIKQYVLGDELTHRLLYQKVETLGVLVINICS